MNKKGYHVMHLNIKPRAEARRQVGALTAALIIVGAAWAAADYAMVDGTALSAVSWSDIETANGLAVSDSAAAMVVETDKIESDISEDIFVEGCAVNDDLQTDIGGELTETGEQDIQQALPANVRLDRPTIDIEVTKPLQSARISSFFGYRKNPVTGKYTFHKGLDLAAPGGTEIKAMYSGRVTTASYDKGYGNYVIIDHGDFQTLYAHCSKLKCSVGDNVSAGSVVALVGSTGNSTGNHLHVEFRRDGQRYDPEWILGGIYS